MGTQVSYLSLGSEKQWPQIPHKNFFRSFEILSEASIRNSYYFHFSKTIGKGLDLEKADAFAFMAYNNENKLLKALLDKNGNFTNTKNSLDDTPLHVACRQRNVDGINLLLEYGADISIKNSDGILPYEMLLLAIDASSCFNEAFDLK